MDIPVVSIVGQSSNSGKTTLLVKLIAEAKNRGWRVAAVKHDVHGFDLDKPGKDTWRLAQAGADVVAISSPEKMAIIEKVQEERTLEEVLRQIKDVDIIFTEGYKHGGQPRIEVFRSEVHEKLLSKPEQLIAIASDVPFEIGVPCFDLNDAKSICDFLQEKYGLPLSGTRGQ